MLFNRARAIDYMREYGLDVLVATSPVNITYFTDYFCWIDPLFKEYMMVPGHPPTWPKPMPSSRLRASRRWS